jgi:hypothetical protein
MSTVFLLSPARCDGLRAKQYAHRLGEDHAELGDAFAWLSALYFRGKLTYARRFGFAQVMAPGRGLCPPETSIGADALRTMGTVPVESDAFAGPLARDARRLRAKRVVLLGSIATGKYTDTLLEVLGERLLFPSDFVGRGDMSRGGMLLRAARSGEELAYRPVAGAVVHGTRPPKLAALR